MSDNHGVMYKRLLKLYKIKMITEAQLGNAVTVKGWISESEKQEILQSVE